MIVLGVETAQAGGSVAVRQDGRVVAAGALPEGKTQAELLLPLIAATLADAQLAYADVQLLAVGVGPGLFTGVRVGLAAVRGLRLVLKVPAIGIGTLHAVAARARDEVRAGETLFVVNDARNDEVYAQRFTARAEPIDDAVLLPLADAGRAVPADAVLLGTAATMVSQLAGRPARLLVGYGAADAATIAALAEARALVPGFRDDGPPRPFYLRKPHARTLDEAKR
jgi:tRNA threonylcarbamoyladenosine biosynthesis protein TsaB